MTSKYFRSVLAALLLLCGATFVYAQSSLPSSEQYQKSFSRMYKKATLPTSNTVVTTSTVFLDVLYLSNKTASTVTVTIVDSSTDCNGGPCTIWPTITMQANQVYTTPMLGIEATGLSWSASVGNAVDAQIQWRQ